MFRELFRAEELMRVKFPESAKQSTMRARAQIEYATVLQRMAKTQEANKLLTEAVSNLEAAVEYDQTQSSRIALARAHIAPAAVLTKPPAPSEAQQELQRAAEIAAKIASEHPTDFEFLNQVAALHSGLNDAYDTLKLDEFSPRITIGNWNFANCPSRPSPKTLSTVWSVCELMCGTDAESSRTETLQVQKTVWRRRRQR